MAVDVMVVGADSVTVIVGSAVIGPTWYCAPTSFQYCDVAIFCVKDVMLDASGSPGKRMATTFGALITGPPRLCTSGKVTFGFGFTGAVSGTSASGGSAASGSSVA